MKVKKSELIELFVALGVDTAAGWPALKLEQKVNAKDGLGRYLEPGQTVPDGPARNLFDAIEAARIQRTPVVVEDDGPVPEPVLPSKPVVDKKPKAAAPKPPKKEKKGSSRYEGFANWKAYHAHLRDNPKTLDESKPGVLVETVKTLRAAGKEGTGVTKEHLLGVLALTFPDRDKDKMEITLNNNVPARLRWMYGIHVWTGKDASGVKTYWIKGDGKTPQYAGVKQPKVSKAPAEPKAKTAPKASAKKPAEPKAKTASKAPAKKPAPKKKAVAAAK